MPFKIAETFQVQAPVDRVWRYLIDPRQVVECLPGAELTEVQGDQTYLGKIKVKVGPVTAGYNGRAHLTEVNEAEHLVRMTGEGRETGGAGSAKMNMVSRVVALPAGGCDVRVNAEVDVAGKIMQFGRGMIDSVSKQLFRQFAECTRARLETSGDPGVSADAASVAPAAAAADDGTTMPSTSAAAAPSEPTSRAAAPADATRVHSSRAGRPPSTTRPAGATRSQGAAPIRILPLIARAVWSSITGLFRRRART